MKEIVGGVEESVEERLARVWAVLKGEGYKYGEKWEQGKRDGGQKLDEMEKDAGRKYTDAEKKYEAGKERAYEKGQEARANAGEKVKVTGEKIKGEL